MPAKPTIREQLLAEPRLILTRLPTMGRVMVVAHDAGTTHERIGTVDTVIDQGGTMMCRGEFHDSEIDLALVGAVVVDRSGSMKDNIMPRLEFIAEDGAALFRIVGLEGLSKFDAGLWGIATSALPEAMAAASDEKPQVEDDDPGGRPLEAATVAATPITIEFRRSGITQRWRGVVEAVRPAMGFVNVMSRDFHLHLRGGEVSSWKMLDHAEMEVELHAIGKSGVPTGLVLRGPRAAFGDGVVKQ